MSNNYYPKMVRFGLTLNNQGNWNDYIDINKTNWKYYALDI